MPEKESDCDKDPNLLPGRLYLDRETMLWSRYKSDHDFMDRMKDAYVKEPCPVCDEVTGPCRCIRLANECANVDYPPYEWTDED